MPDLSEHGDVYELGFGLGPENPPTSAIIKPEYRRKLLYHMSPQQVSLLFHFIYNLKRFNVFKCRKIRPTPYKNKSPFNTKFAMFITNLYFYFYICVFFSYNFN